MSGQRGAGPHRTTPNHAEPRPAAGRCSEADSCGNLARAGRQTTRAGVVLMFGSLSAFDFFMRCGCG